MTDNVIELIEKSKQSLQAGEVLFKEKFYDFSASRLYYSMFYILEALLLKDKLSFSKHSAIISAFAKKYIKTEILPKEYHRMILDAFEMRHTGDYGAFNALDKEQVEKLLNNANLFVNEIVKLF